jgi:hypothetical protein
VRRRNGEKGGYAYIRRLCYASRVQPANNTLLCSILVTYEALLRRGGKLPDVPAGADRLARSMVREVQFSLARTEDKVAALHAELGAFVNITPRFSRNFC